MSELKVSVNVHLWNASLRDILELSPDIYFLANMPQLEPNPSIGGREVRYSGRRIISVHQENGGSGRILYRVGDKGNIKGFQGESDIGCGKYNSEKIAGLRGK